MEAQTLRPQKKEINLKGKLSYSWEVRAWNTIRLKKEIVNEFPQLKERLSAFGYNLVFFQDYNDFEKATRKIKKNKEALPILLWLVKEKTL
ncbi:MAG: hypothetical protein WC533_04880 [Candidatus Pacearchaeota archaeon]